MDMSFAPDHTYFCVIYHSSSSIIIKYSVLSVHRFLPNSKISDSITPSDISNRKFCIAQTTASYLATYAFSPRFFCACRARKALQIFCAVRLRFIFMYQMMLQQYSSTVQ